jgi:hypothetical protein
MNVKTSAQFVIGLSLFISAATPAHTQELTAADRVLTFTNGCVQAIAGGHSVHAFAAKAGAEPAPEQLAQALLGKEAGEVFVKDDPEYPVAVAERVDGCSVHARVLGDLAPLIDAADDFIAGPGGRFYRVRAYEEATGTAGWTTHYIYAGKRAGKSLTLVLSTTPGAEGFDRVSVTVAETKR